MFYIIRVLIGLLIFAVCIIIIALAKKTKKFKTILTLILLAVITVTVCAAMVIPVENAFMSFSAPENAYRYNNKGDLELTVEGKATDCLIGRENNGTVHLCIYPKSESNLKLGLPFDTKKVYSTIKDGTVIQLYEYKNTEEYYISVLLIDNEEKDISDNCQSVFYQLNHYNKPLDKTYYTYYAYVKDINENYNLKIGKNSFQINMSEL